MDEDEDSALDEFGADVEEHLYAKLHHGQVESGGIKKSPGGQNRNQEETPGRQQKEKNVRYFATSKRGGAKPWVKGSGQKRAPVLGLDVEKQPQEISRPTPVKFTPYSSILSEMNLSATEGQNLRRNPAKIVREAKNCPGKAKKKNKKKKKVETIVLESSEDEEEDDDVVEVPVPPPPLVCIDSSDEESSVTKQKASKPLQPRQRVSSSPSSSIFSDDFIIAKDRIRLRESQAAVHVEEEELRAVQQQSRSPQKRTRAPPPPPRITPADLELPPDASDISTSDSEDFLPDGTDETPKRRFQKRKKLPPSPKGIPYIRRGEALPNADNLPKRKSIDTASNSAPRSDDEFMNILTTIAHGESTTSLPTGEEEEEEENDTIEIEDDPVPEDAELLLNISSPGNPPESPSEEEDSSPPGAAAEIPLPESPSEDPPARTRLIHGWNEEMHKFYDESWGGENFSIQKILDEMPADKSQWQISAKDYNYSRYHRKSREPQEFKLVCYMCGQQGHREPRCPNTLCLKCGNRTMVFGFACSNCADWNSRTCGICNNTGHTEDLCPDTWRRYHSTTEDGPPVEEPISLSEKKWCSVCARSGHTADTCHHPVRILEYPATSWRVSSYSPVYECDEAAAAANPGDPFQTYRGARIKFNWSESVKKSPFYRRFREHCYGERQEEEKEPERQEEESLVPLDRTNANIFLAKDFCRDLLSPRGQAFLKQEADRLMVEVNLRTSKTNSALRLIGAFAGVEEFKENLTKFLSMKKRPISQTPEDISLGCQIIPRNRIKLINFLKTKIRELTEYVGNAPNLYAEMKNNEGFQTGARRQRQADFARTKLNMILMGQAGLREGRIHLRALEADVRMLERDQEPEVADNFRNSVFIHYKYIFTDHHHGNYEELLRQFHNLKATNKLPKIALPQHPNANNLFRQQRRKQRYFRNQVIS